MFLYKILIIETNVDSATNHIAPKCSLLHSRTQHLQFMAGFTNMHFIPSAYIVYIVKNNTIKDMSKVFHRMFGRDGFRLGIFIQTLLTGKQICDIDLHHFNCHGTMCSVGHLLFAVWYKMETTQKQHNVI